MENLSAILKKRRKELGLTLAQIAEQMGVAEATVQRWESGNIKSIRYEKIDKLSEILKVSPASFMGWSGTEEPTNENERKKENPTPVSESGLSKDETALIELFRRVPQEQRAAMLQAIEMTLRSQGLL